MIRLFLILCLGLPSLAQWAVKGETVYTMAGEAIANGVIVIRDGKIAAIGPEATTPIPQDFQVKQAKIVTPGLIDAHTVVGLAGYLNQDHDQDQLDSSSPIQPTLRAIDAYNAREALVKWVREFGVTTLHTGHGPGALVSGQTMIVKSSGDTVDEAMVEPMTMLAVTLGESARSSKSPGTRAKMVAMLRAKLANAKNKAEAAKAKPETKSGKKGKKGKKGKAKDEKPPKPPTDLEGDVWAEVISGKVPLLITAHRAQDIANALRIVDEFGIRMILDGGAEAYLMMDELKERNIPVILHPTMSRTFGEMENASMTSAAKLMEGGLAVALQSGYEGYVPKTRVVLFEAAVAAAYGLSFEQALATITTTPAEILGISDRVGSLKVGMDADIALFDGDPFEYTSHVTGVFINGELVSNNKQ